MTIENDYLEFMNELVENYNQNEFERFLQMEKQFLNRMLQFKQKLIQPFLLQSKTQKGPITEAQVRILFGFLDPVLQIHQTFLNDLLAVKHFPKQWLPLFKRQILLFQIYPMYAFGLFQSKKLLEKLTKEEPKLMIFMTHLIGGNSVSELLSLPWKRLEAYPESLKKFSNEMPEFKVVANDMQTILIKMQYKWQDLENQYKIVDLQKQLELPKGFQLVEPGRKLLADFECFSFEGLYIVQKRIYIFNDLLILLKEGQLDCIFSLKFSKLTEFVTELETSKFETKENTTPLKENESLSLFRIKNEKQELIIICKSQQQKLILMDLIAKTISQANELQSEVFERKTWGKKISWKQFSQAKEDPVNVLLKQEDSQWTIQIEKPLRSRVNAEQLDAVLKIQKKKYIRTSVDIFFDQ